MTFFKSKYFRSVIIVFVIFLSFFSGFKYAQVRKYLDEKLFILNMRGHEIIVVNEQLGLVDTKPISNVRTDYNYYTILFIGCSGELANLKYLGEKDLKLFYDGIGIAIEQSNLSKNISDPCIENVINKYEEYLQKSKRSQGNN